MFGKPSASFYASLPYGRTEYYRRKAIVQVSRVSVVHMGTKRILSGCLRHRAPAPRWPVSAELGSAAGCAHNFWTCWMYIAQALQSILFYFCIEIYRSPSHLLPHLLPRQSRCGRRAAGEPVQVQLLHRATCSPCTTMAMARLVSVTVSVIAHLSSLRRAREHRRKKSPVLIWCSKDLLEVNPNSSINLLLPSSNSLHNIAGIREFYDFLKTLHK